MVIVHSYVKLPEGKGLKSEVDGIKNLDISWYIWVKVGD